MTSLGRFIALAALFAVVALLASCVTASVDRSLGQYRGQTLQAAIDRFGPPERVVPDGTGGKVAYWSWVHDSRTVLFHFRIDPQDRIVGSQWTFREQPPDMPQDQPRPVQ